MIKLYQKRIAEFMWDKNKRLKKLKIVADYMTGEIEKEIFKWKSKDAKRVYNKLKNNIFDDDLLVVGLRSNNCPYCLKMDAVDRACFFCFYGKIQGMCDDSNSVIRNIKKELNKAIDDCSGYCKFSAKYLLIRIFSNKYYRKLIKKIENNIK